MIAKIISFSLLFLIFVNGCEKPADRSAVIIINKARQCYNRQDYSLALKQLTALLNNDLSPKVQAEVYYLRGLAYRELAGTYLDLAYKDLNLAVRYTADPRLSALANMALGHICFEKDPPDSVQAILYYEDSLQAQAEDIPLDVIYYRLGVSLQRVGQWNQAQKYFTRCVSECSSSKYTLLAEKQKDCDHYSLLADTFVSMERASETQDKLKQQNWPARIEKISIKDVDSFLVLVGNYQTYLSAEQNLRELLLVCPEASVKTDN